MTMVLLVLTVSSIGIWHKKTINKLSTIAKFVKRATHLQVNWGN